MPKLLPMGIATGFPADQPRHLAASLQKRWPLSGLAEGLAWASHFKQCSSRFPRVKRNFAPIHCAFDAGGYPSRGRPCFSWRIGGRRSADLSAGSEWTRIRASAGFCGGLAWKRGVAAVAAELLEGRTRGSRPALSERSDQEARGRLLRRRRCLGADRR